MFKKYDNVYIKHNSYTDARYIGGKVGYIADVAQDMYTVKVPHKTGFEAEYILYAHELESLEPKHGYPRAVTAIGYIQREQTYTVEYWQGFTDGMARAIELFTEGTHD